MSSFCTSPFGSACGSPDSSFCKEPSGGTGSSFCKELPACDPKMTHLSDTPCSPVLEVELLAPEVLVVLLQLHLLLLLVSLF